MSSLKTAKNELQLAREDYKEAQAKHSRAKARLAGASWLEMPDDANQYFTTQLDSSRFDVGHLTGVAGAYGTPRFAVSLDPEELLAVLQTDEGTKKTEVDTKRETVEAKKDATQLAWGTTAATWSTVLLIVLTGLAIGFGVHGAQEDGVSDTKHDLWVSLVIVGGALPLMLAGLGLAWFRAKGGGVVGFIVGKNNRLSTSQLQILLWTSALVFAFGMFVSEMAFDIELKDKEGFKGFDETYLFLLGGPFAAAVLAKFTATIKTDDQTTQQAKADTPTGKDLATDDSGATSLTDLQFLLFNLAALAFFAVGFADDPRTLPTIEATLVGLTSISALTYVGGKVVNSNPPSITSVSIVSGGDAGKLVAGQTVIRVVGKNFLPSGTDKNKDLNATVLVGGTEMGELTLKTNTELQGQVPEGVATGQTTIVVRTAEGATSEEWTKLSVV